MHFSQEILSLRTEVKDLFAIADYDEAVKRLIDFTRNYCPEKEDEAVMISADYHELKDERYNLVKGAKAKLARKQITLRALTTLESAWQSGSNNLLRP